jgi:hypothetical protein
VKPTRPLLGALAGILVGVLVVLVLAILVQTWGLVDAIRENQKINTETLRILQDCTVPENDCYERSQKRTAEAVGDINKITLYAAACADRPGEQTIVEIQSCVLHRLAAEDN